MAKSANNYNLNLLEAVQHGNLAMVETLLATHRSPNQCNQDSTQQEPLLAIATKLSNVAVAKCLLKYGAQVNQVDNAGETALFYAIKQGYNELIELLLEHGASLSHQNKNLETCLHCAIDYLNDDEMYIAQHLLQKSQQSTLDTDDKDGDTPLIRAIKLRQPAWIKLLLHYHASINQANKQGQTPLFIAASMQWASINQEDMISYLIAHGSTVNATNKQGQTALAIATYYRHPENIDTLLREGASVDLADENGTTPLAIAVKQGDLSIVECLIQHHASTNLMDKQGKTPLMIAIEQGHTAIVNYLLELNVPINQVDKHGKTPLIIAVEQGQTEIVHHLLDQGASTTTQVNDHETALSIAKKNGHAAITSLLELHHAPDTEDVLRQEEILAKRMQLFNHKMSLTCSYLTAQMAHLAKKPSYEFTQKKSDILSEAYKEFLKLKNTRCTQKNVAQLENRFNRLANKHFNPNNLNTLKERRGLFKWLTKLKNNLVAILNFNRKPANYFFKPSSLKTAEKITAMKTSSPKRH